jgi:hypothetical protein
MTKSYFLSLSEAEDVKKLKCTKIQNVLPWRDSVSLALDTVMGERGIWPEVVVQSHKPTI